MKKYQKITKERFDRIKTLTNIGIKNTEVCRALNVSNPVVINVKKSEDFEAYKARNLARKLKYTKPVVPMSAQYHSSIDITTVSNADLQKDIKTMQATLDQCVTYLQTLTDIVEPKVNKKPWRF